MKKCYRGLITVFAGAMLLGLSASAGLSADTPDTVPANPVIQKKVTAAERQAAAKRAAAKGFVVPSKVPSSTPGATPPPQGGQ